MFYAYVFRFKYLNIYIYIHTPFSQDRFGLLQPKTILNCETHDDMYKDACLIYIYRRNTYTSEKKKVKI